MRSCRLKSSVMWEMVRGKWGEKPLESVGITVGARGDGEATEGFKQVGDMIRF